MLRFLILAALPYQLQAQVSAAPPANGGETSSSSIVGAGNEIRLRCGSDALRQQVIAEGSDGKSSVPTPKAGPAAGSDAAHSDGRLILYKRPDGDALVVGGDAAGDVPCSGEQGSQGTGKSAIPAK